MEIKIGTRGSALALWQAYYIENMIVKNSPSISTHILKVKTKGDKILDAPLAKIGDKGLFTKELDNALLQGKIDLAVHSMKDVPTQLPDGILIAAVPTRGVVEDVFVSNKYNSLQSVPKGGTIATGSLRRKSQLLAMRPDLHVVDIRGNVNTRLAKLDESNWDGMILARAGLERLKLENRIKEIFDISTFIPAVGQGALAVVCRSDNEELIQWLRQNIQDESTYLRVVAERAFLRTLEGGCQIPIGCHAVMEQEQLKLYGFIGNLDGTEYIRHSISGDKLQAEQLGKSLAKEMIKMGAEHILSSLRGS